jgi:hypothetical protein
MYNIQIDDLVRPATTAEVAAFKAKETQEAKKQNEVEAKVIAKAALLEKLGITADEAQLLLG